MAFIKYLKNQVWTLLPDIRDLIPLDHICYLVESSCVHRLSIKFHLLYMLL